MRIAIFGGGSIGSRHAANARALGHEALVYDTDARRGLHPDNFLGDYLNAFQAAMICTPASTHEAVATMLLDRGYAGPLFVEKPLALRSAATIFQNWPHPVTMVGYNWRFHSELAPLRVLAHRRMTLHLDVRTDMRRWPGAGYGDPLLECSHEVDLACAWLGDPSSIQGGSLDEGTGAWVQLQHPLGDSVIDVRWQTEPMRTATAHLAGVPGSPGRTSVLVSLDVRPNAIGVVQSYFEELVHFLSCAEFDMPTACPFAQGLRVVAICERVKERAA